MLTNIQIAEEIKRLVGDKYDSSTIEFSVTETIGAVSICSCNGHIACAGIKYKEAGYSISEFSERILVPMVEHLEESDVNPTT